MTGNTSTSEVTRILEKVESSCPPGEAPDAILATSMISHGVDVDRFNECYFMVCHGRTLNTFRLLVALDDGTLD